MKAYHSIFPFQWNCNEEPYEDQQLMKERGWCPKHTVIRVWGWNENNEGISLIIDDFQIPMWIELPLQTIAKPGTPAINISWSDRNIRHLEDFIMKEMPYQVSSRSVKAEAKEDCKDVVMEEVQTTSNSKQVTFVGYVKDSNNNNVSYANFKKFDSWDSASYGTSDKTGRFSITCPPKTRLWIHHRNFKKKQFTMPDTPSRNAKDFTICLDARSLKISEKPIQQAYEDKAPLYFIREEKKRLYNNEFIVLPNGKVDSRSDFVFLKACFYSQSQLENFAMQLHDRELDVAGLGKIKLRCHATNRNLTPVMKLMAQQKIPSTNWIQFQVDSELNVNQRQRSCKKKDYVVLSSELKPHPQSTEMPVVYPNVCSFDLEVYSHERGKFPEAQKSKDEIIQIGCVFANKNGIYRRYCLTLKNPVMPANYDCVITKFIQPTKDKEGRLKSRDDSWLAKDVPASTNIIVTCQTEKQLLEAWTELVILLDPDVLIGYNIFGFDIRYMYDRAEKILQCPEMLEKFTAIQNDRATYKEVEWESEARGKVHLGFFEAHGRLFIDLLPLVKASDTQLNSYKLETVATKYLKINKDPIKPNDIHDCIAQNNMPLLGLVAKYCIQDCVVTYELYQKMLIWFGLVESATTNKVPIFCMVTQGQQIKAYAQVYDFCLHNNYVVNVPEKEDKKNYVGAIVTKPIPGIYETILPFDFASLYPSIIIAKNIDFSTIVYNVEKSGLPPSCYEHFKWSDHVNCSKQGCSKDTIVKKLATDKKFDDDGLSLKEKVTPTIVCDDYDFAFIKSDKGPTGVIPSIIQNLLAARKTVRKEIEKNEEIIEQLEEQDPEANANQIRHLKEVNIILDKRQLAYKVNANSMYGMYGAANGYLPFFHGAATVTRVGRQSILKASDLIKQKGGQVIYNDTDSAYCYFNELKGKTPQEIFDFAAKMVEYIADPNISGFTKPMKLEFENKIYSPFLIVTKKMYIAQMLDTNGKPKDKMYIKGLPLVRREYCSNLKELYQNCVNYIMSNIRTISGAAKRDLRKNAELYNGYLDLIMSHLIDIFSRHKRTVEDRKNERMGKSYDYKDFIIYRELKQEAEKYAVKFAHAEVAKKMNARGVPVSVSTRIEYVLLAEPNNRFNKQGKQFTIAEDAEYFDTFREILRLDYLQYLKSQYVNRLNQLTETIFGNKLVNDRPIQAVSVMFSYLVNKNAVVTKIKETAWKHMMKNITTTANGSYPLALVLKDSCVLYESVQPLYDHLKKIYADLDCKDACKPGTFAFDCIANMIASYHKQALPSTLSIDKHCESLYNTWLACFNYWKTMDPPRNNKGFVTTQASCIYVTSQMLLGTLSMSPEPYFNKCTQDVKDFFEVLALALNKDIVSPVKKRKILTREQIDSKRQKYEIELINQRHELQRSTTRRVIDYSSRVADPYLCLLWKTETSKKDLDENEINDLWEQYKKQYRQPSTDFSYMRNYNTSINSKDLSSFKYPDDQKHIIELYNSYCKLVESNLPTKKRRKA